MPVRAARALDIGDEQPAVRGFPVGRQVELPSGDRGGEGGVKVVDDRDDRAVGGQVFQIDLGLLATRAVPDADEEPAAVVRDVYAHAEARVEPLTEDEFIRPRVGSDGVPVDARTLHAVLAVVDGPVVVGEREPHVAGLGEGVGKVLPRVHLQHPGGQLILAAFAEAVHDK